MPLAGDGCLPHEDPPLTSPYPDALSARLIHAVAKKAHEHTEAGLYPSVARPRLWQSAVCSRQHLGGVQLGVCCRLQAARGACPLCSKALSAPLCCQQGVLLLPAPGRMLRQQHCNQRQPIAAQESLVRTARKAAGERTTSWVGGKLSSHPLTTAPLTSHKQAGHGKRQLARLHLRCRAGGRCCCHLQLAGHTRQAAL